MSLQNQLLVQNNHLQDSTAKRSEIRCIFSLETVFRMTRLFSKKNIAPTFASISPLAPFLRTKNWDGVFGWMTPCGNCAISTLCASAAGGVILTIYGDSGMWRSLNYNYEIMRYLENINEKWKKNTRKWFDDVYCVLTFKLTLYCPGSLTVYATLHDPSLRSLKLISALLGPSIEIAIFPSPASRVQILNSAGTPTSPNSKPQPPALTKWEPESLNGPTVNWNGEPIQNYI